LTDLTTAGVPAVRSEDRVRGEGPDAIVYLDLACPHCAATWQSISELALRLVFRHFPVASKHPRAPALHAAAEAAARQGSFWQMCDSLYADRGRVDDPHLWERAERFDLDLDRFNADRRSAAVRQRVERDFVTGVRAGVTGTPTAFADGRMIRGHLVDSLAQLPSARPGADR
jgi:protein-disulfide isomerase